MASYFSPNYQVYQNLVNGLTPNMVQNTQTPVPVDVPEQFKHIPTVPEPEVKSVSLNFNGAVYTEDVKPGDEPVNMDFSRLTSNLDPEIFIRQQFEAQTVNDPKDVVIYNTVPQIQQQVPLINNPMDSICNGRKISNWFTRMAEQRGEDFITSGKVSVDEIGKNVDRIIDDIIAGRIDYSKQGKYLIEPMILDTLIDYCANKVNLNTANLYAQNYFYTDYMNRINYIQSDPERYGILNPGDNMIRNIVRSMSISDRDIGIYTILYNKFNTVKATKNATILISLNNELNNYRKLAKANK